jgi:ABC-type transport system involved in cytochrome bd biosynthesis fused ATPase/permease subunit
VLCCCCKGRVSVKPRRGAVCVCCFLQTDIINRLSGGAQSGRAAAAEKALEKIKAEGEYVEKPYVPKKRSFAFPPVDRMGQRVLTIRNLTHGYHDTTLFDDTSLEIEKGERVAFIGARSSALHRWTHGSLPPVGGHAGFSIRR